MPTPHRLGIEFGNTVAPIGPVTVPSAMVPSLALRSELSILRDSASQSARMAACFLPFLVV